MDQSHSKRRDRPARRPDDSEGALRRELRRAKATIAMLRAQLEAAGVEVPRPPAWGVSMTPQELALVTALRRAWPRAIDDGVMDDLLPHFDPVAERCATLIPAVVSRARRKLPQGAIERVRGLGYRLSDAAAQLLS